MVEQESLRGVLNPAAVPAKFQLARHAPAPDLAYFVQHYWMVAWDLRGQPPHCSETLPFPCVNIVAEPGKTLVHGVISGRYTTRLAGVGNAFGMTFRPGGFRGILGAPLHTIVDAALDPGALFGGKGAALAAGLAASEDADARIACAERFLRAHAPAPDPNAELVNAIVAAAMAERALRRVSDLAAYCGCSQRTLQRLFREYIGLGPKWMVQRFRLQQAAELLARTDAPPWPVLAAELGYFDQAHFINEFKAVLGRTPSAYVQSLDQPWEAQKQV